jgi:hypothetical protein
MKFLKRVIQGAYRLAVSRWRHRPRCQQANKATARFIGFHGLSPKVQFASRKKSPVACGKKLLRMAGKKGRARTPE